MYVHWRSDLTYGFRGGSARVMNTASNQWDRGMHGHEHGAWSVRRVVAEDSICYVGEGGGGIKCWDTHACKITGASCSRAGLTATQRNLGHALAGDAHFCVRSHNASSFISHPRLLAACRPGPFQEKRWIQLILRMGHFQPQNTLHTGALKNCGQKPI